MGCRVWSQIFAAKNEVWALLFEGDKMKISRFLCAMVVAGATLIMGSAAWAGGSPMSLSQTKSFSFDLLPALSDQALPINIADYSAVWAGNGQVSFDWLFPAGYTLEKVTLEVEMEINGELEIINPNQLSATQLNPQTNGIGARLEVYALGKAESGPLVAPIDFGTYEVGVDGVIINDILEITESGVGMDMTDGLGEVAFFVANNPVAVDLAACLMVNYLGNVGNAGTAESFQATGDVTLTYDFAPVVTGTVIPTPAALPAGLLALAGLALGRRRRHAA